MIQYTLTDASGAACDTWIDTRPHPLAAARHIQQSVAHQIADTGLELDDLTFHERDEAHPGDYWTAPEGDLVAMVTARVIPETGLMGTHAHAAKMLTGADR